MQPTPVVPVFQVVLPNGKVLMWDSVGDSATETQAIQTFTRAAVWDPEQDTFHQVNVSGYNIFCVGFGGLADGQLFMAGGHIADNVGLDFAYTYDPVSNAWTPKPKMNAG